MGAMKTLLIELEAAGVTGDIDLEDVLELTEKYEGRTGEDLSMRDAAVEIYRTDKTTHNRRAMPGYMEGIVDRMIF